MRLNESSSRQYVKDAGFAFSMIAIGKEKHSRSVYLISLRTPLTGRPSYVVYVFPDCNRRVRDAM